mmetsp:Transcript_4506/g.12531  ORF Transcript_4506/g.12531 Transcript_4506/m.12531 type:complete len:272 (+) Transcript_4506:805-1620(+)
MSDPFVAKEFHPIVGGTALGPIVRLRSAADRIVHVESEFAFGISRRGKFRRIGEVHPRHGPPERSVVGSTGEGEVFHDQERPSSVRVISPVIHLGDAEGICAAALLGRSSGAGAFEHGPQSQRLPLEHLLRRSAGALHEEGRARGRRIADLDAAEGRPSGRSRRLGRRHLPVSGARGPRRQFVVQGGSHDSGGGRGGGGGGGGGGGRRDDSRSDGRARCCYRRGGNGTEEAGGGSGGVRSRDECYGQRDGSQAGAGGRYAVRSAAGGRHGV